MFSMFKKKVPQPVVVEDDTVNDSLLTEVAEVSLETAWEIGKSFVDSGSVGVAIDIATSIALSVVDLGKEAPMIAPIAGVLRQFFDCYQTMQANASDFVEMKDKLSMAEITFKNAQSVFKNLTSVDPAVELALKRMCKSVVDCTNLVKALDKRYNEKQQAVAAKLLNFTLSGKDKEKIASCVSRVASSLSDFSNCLSNWVNLKNASKLFNDDRLPKLKSILTPTVPDQNVKKLLKAHNYRSDSRQWLHVLVKEWLVSVSTSKKNLKNKLFWLQAGAGMGKSVFSAALVDRMMNGVQFDDVKLLGAVFIKFSDVNQSNPVNVLKSLVYQIAVGFPDCIDGILKSLEVMRNGNETVLDYFDDVLLPALVLIEKNHSTETQPMKNMLIVIDALDEAGVEGSSSRESLIQLFSVKYLRKLPDWVKLFVTGRPEVDLINALKPYSHVIDENDERHVKDLHEFIRFSLEEVLENVNDVETALTILMTKSENKFLYLAVIAEDLVEWYGEEDSKFSVEGFMVLLNQLPNGLNDSYRKTFEKLFQAVPSKCLTFLQLLVSSVEPLSVDEVKFFMDMDDNRVIDEFNSLVKHVETVFPLRESTVEDSRIPVLKFFPFHKSVVDWLRSVTVSGKFYCDIKVGDAMICRKLLDRAGIISCDTGSMNISLKTDDFLFLVKSDECIKKYLLKHLLEHLDRCPSDLKYHNIVYYLLTSLPWIQCCLRTFGVQWLMREYAIRYTNTNWLKHTQCSQDFTLLLRLYKLIVAAPSSRDGFDWYSEICTQISGRLQSTNKSSDRIKQLVIDACDYIKTNGGWLVDNDAMQTPYGVNEIFFQCKRISCMCLVSPCLVAVGMEPTLLELWNVDTGYVEMKFESTESVESLVYVAPKYLICVGTYGTIRKWNIETGECELTVERKSRAVPYLCALSSGNVCLKFKDHLLFFDMITGDCVESKLSTANKFSGGPLCIPGNMTVVVDDDNSFVVWKDIEKDCKMVFNYKCNGDIVAHVMVEECLIVQSDTIYCFNVNDWSVTFTIEGVDKSYKILPGILKDGLAICNPENVGVYSLANGSLCYIVPWKMNLFNGHLYVILPCGRIAIGALCNFFVVNPQKFNESKPKETAMVDKIFTSLPDGKLVTQTENIVQIWKNMTEVELSIEYSEDDLFDCCCLNSEGKLILAGQGNNHWKLWNYLTGEVQTMNVTFDNLSKVMLLSNGCLAINGYQRCGQQSIFILNHEIEELKLVVANIPISGWIFPDQVCLKDDDKTSASVYNLISAFTKVGSLSNVEFVLETLNEGSILVNDCVTKQITLINTNSYTKTNKSFDYSMYRVGDRFSCQTYSFYWEAGFEEGLRLIENKFVFCSGEVGGPLVYATYHPKK